MMGWDPNPNGSDALGTVATSEKDGDD